MTRRELGSDNFAGIHPAVLQAIADANQGHVTAYGADPWTARLEGLARSLFGADAEVFPVFNGTAANVLSLQCMLETHQAVLCAETSHIHVDECGAPERYTGSKLIPLHAPQGKLTPHLIQEHLRGIGNQHHVQPKVISISQCTEYGTVYTLQELKELSAFARTHQLFLHMDGARISNAAASLGVSLGEITRDCGVDIVSWGGTKNGALAAEAVVILNPQLGQSFKYQRKQAMQLSSKMRFISAQLLALYEGDLWLKNARHSNQMARELQARLRQIQGIEITQPVEANSVFAKIPRGSNSAMTQTSFFYVWNESQNEVRLMTSFDTELKDIEAFTESAQRACREFL